MVTRAATAPPSLPVQQPQSNGKGKTFTVNRGIVRKAQRVLIYGTGGVGKSTLARDTFPNPIFVDLERGTDDMDVRRVGGIETWADLKSWLQTGDFKNVETIIIDTATTAEELCRQHVIANVKTERGLSVTSIEGYGYGKGTVHLFEEWKRMMAELDRHFLAGRNVGLIAHERIGKVPNPVGDDYIRYEPRLQASDKGGIMHATKEWCDHVLFVNYDVAASDGKAKGSGTRTIYTAETATHLAKSRTLPPSPIVFELNKTNLWTLMNNKQTAGELPPL